MLTTKAECAPLIRSQIFLRSSSAEFVGGFAGSILDGLHGFGLIRDMGDPGLLIGSWPSGRVIRTADIAFFLHRRWIAVLV